ncbi:MAG: type II toxin-antitoxin system VapC family toxin [Longimicrobiales bacterium]
MRVLLDTHCWLWILTDPEKFSRRALRIVESRSNELFLSAASAWEISIKHALGKIKIPGRIETVVPDLMQKTAVLPLPITHAHALRAGGLPGHHRDPFDRLLIAQAQLERLPILSADQSLEPYDVKVLAA